ncbi:hypothetical protein P9112_003873 [Eukaryota sp. TZLM1-RC]
MIRCALFAWLALLLIVVSGDPVYTLIVRNANSWYDFHYKDTITVSGAIAWKGGKPGNIGAGKTVSYRFFDAGQFIQPRENTLVSVVWVTHTMFGNPKETISMDISMDERGWLTNFDCSIEDPSSHFHPCDVRRDDREITVVVDTSQR